MKALLSCTLEPGQFSTEFSTHFVSADGRLIPLLIDWDHPALLRGPLNTAWLSMEIADVRDGKYLLRLPVDGFNGERNIVVRRDQIARFVG